MSQLITHCRIPFAGLSLVELPDSLDPVCQIIAKILFQYDPMRINFGENTGEYITEARWMAAFIGKGANEKEIGLIVDRVLSEWFSSRWFVVRGKASKRTQVHDIGSAIWKALNPVAKK